MQQEKEINKVLQERAKALSKPLHEEQMAASSFEGLGFRLANETYAIDMDYVKEVSFVKNLTELPCTPAFVVGIINLRGSILAVVDVKLFLNLPTEGVSDANRLIIVQKEDIQIALLADEVLGALNIEKELTQEKSSSGEEFSKFISGVYKQNMIILDIDLLLSSKEIIIDEEV